MADDKKEQGGAEIPTFLVPGKNIEKKGAEIPPLVPLPNKQPNETNGNTGGNASPEATKDDGEGE